MNRANASFARGNASIMGILGKGVTAATNLQQIGVQAAQKGLEVVRKARTDFMAQQKLLQRASQSFLSSLEKLFGNVSELLSEEEDEDLSAKEKRSLERKKTQRMLGYSSGYDNVEAAFKKAKEQFFTVMDVHVGAKGMPEVAVGQDFSQVPLRQILADGIDSSLEPHAKKLQEALEQLSSIFGVAFSDEMPNISGMDAKDAGIAMTKFVASERMKLSQTLQPYMQLKVQLLSTLGAITSLAHKVLYEPLFSSLKKTHRTMRQEASKRLSAMQSGRDGLVKFFSDNRISDLKSVRDVSKYSDVEIGKQKTSLMKHCHGFTRQKGRYLGGFARLTRAIGIYLGIGPVEVAPPEGMMTDDPRDIVQRSDLATFITDKAKEFRKAFNTYQTEVNKIMASPIGAEPITFVKQFVASRTSTYNAALKDLMRAHNAFMLVGSKSTYGLTYPFVAAAIAQTRDDMYGLLNAVFEVEASDEESADDESSETSDEYGDEYGGGYDDGFGDFEDEPAESPKKKAKSRTEYPTGRDERLSFYKKARKAFWSARIDLLKLCDGAIGRKRMKKIEELEEFEVDADTYTTHRDALQMHVSSLKDLAVGTVGKFPIGRSKIDGYTALKQEMLASYKALHAVAIKKLEEKEEEPEPVIEDVAADEENDVVEEVGGEESDAAEVSESSLEKDAARERLAEIEDAATMTAEEKEEAGDSEEYAEQENMTATDEAVQEEVQAEDDVSEESTNEDDGDTPSGGGNNEEDSEEEELF